MSNSFLSSALPITAAISLLAAGCGKNDSAFDSAQLSRNAIPQAVTVAEPVLVRIPGSNDLLAIGERDGVLFFFRTFSGYATTHAEASLDILRIVTLGRFSGEIGGAVSFVGNTPYMRIPPLEALALFSYDTSKLTKAIEAEYSLSSKSVSPAIFADTIGILLNPPVLKDKNGRIFVGWIAYHEHRLNLQDLTINGMPSLEYFARVNAAIGEVPTDTSKAPLRIALSDGTLLRVIQQVDENEDSLYFSRTSLGYGMSGGKLNLVVGTIGKETPVANVYTATAPKEAKALVDGSWETIFKAALRQADVLPHTVNPYVISNAFNGNMPFISAAAIRRAEREAQAAVDAAQSTIQIQQSMQLFNSPPPGYPGGPF